MKPEEAKKHKFIKGFYEKVYSDELKSVLNLKLRYAKLQDNNFAEAFDISKKALVYADRWSEITLDAQKLQLLKDDGVMQKERPFRDRCYQIYRNLQEMHIHCRQIWNKGEEQARSKKIVQNK